MKYLSLFTGIGGFELGIHQAYVATTYRGEKRGEQKNTEGNAEKGQRLEPKTRENTRTEKGQISKYFKHRPNSREPYCVGYSEIDKYAIETYQKHFPNHTAYGDITKINEKELPDFDLVVGGFPCQSFSIAGKRGGFSDTRGTMFFEICRIVKEKQPRLILLENVKGLLSHDEGRTFRTIITTIDELGYDCQWQVLNSKNFGVPQNRERVFIVGHLRGTPRPEVFPLERSNTNDIKEITRSVPQAQRVYAENGLSPTIDIGAGGNRQPKILQKARGRNKGGIHDISPTISSHKWEHNNHLVDGLIRRLSPLECERLQGFPDNWTAGVSDTQRYKMCGNAVTVNVIQAIMEKLFLT